MISEIKNFMLAGMIMIAGFSVVNVAPVYASSGSCDGFSGLRNGIECGNNSETPDKLFGGEGSLFKTIVDTMLFLIGSLSVIMLIYGGIRYTISRGDSGEVNNAKNTILYAIVGLIVSILAYAIVNFVVVQFAEK